MMKYLPFFTLEIVHTYYADSRCPDFQIEPSQETQKALRDLRFLPKPFPNGIRILAAVDDQGLPFISLPENLLFSFSLKLLNPLFGLFTDLDGYNQLLAPLFTNTQSPSAPDLALTSRQSVFTETLVVQTPAQQESFCLAGRPLDNLQASDFVISGLGKVLAAKGFDQSTGVLQINTAKASQGSPFAVTYAVLPRLDKDVFAEVEITVQPVQANLSGNETIFRIMFKPKETRWKYYIVTNKADNKTVLPSLQDGQNKISFDAAGRTDLNLTPDSSDQIALKLVEHYPDKQYFRFISSDLITCQEVARKNIQLLLDGQKVVEVLSNPSWLNYSIDTRNSLQEYALYQIVEYFTH